jgi:hypothetical protein
MSASTEKSITIHHEVFGHMVTKMIGHTNYNVVAYLVKLVPGEFSNDNLQRVTHCQDVLSSHDT